MFFKLLCPVWRVLLIHYPLQNLISGMVIHLKTFGLSFVHFAVHGLFYLLCTSVGNLTERGGVNAYGVYSDIH